MISDLVGRRIRELRTGRGWSVRRLVDECKAVGVKITSNVIENIEGQQRPKGQPGRRRREISVDELISLAYVLDVSPLVLLLPEQPSEYPVTPTRSVSMAEVYLWMIGKLERPGIPTGFTHIEEEQFARLKFRKELPWTAPPGQEGGTAAAAALQQLLSNLPEETVQRMLSVIPTEPLNSAQKGQVDGSTEDLQGRQEQTGS